jgi:hypothetical protein
MVDTSFFLVLIVMLSTLNVWQSLEFEFDIVSNKEVHTSRAQTDTIYLRKYHPPSLAPARPSLHLAFLHPAITNGSVSEPVAVPALSSPDAHFTTVSRTRTHHTISYHRRSRSFPYYVLRRSNWLESSALHPCSPPPRQDTDHCLNTEVLLPVAFLVGCSGLASCWPAVPSWLCSRSWSFLRVLVLVFARILAGQVDVCSLTDLSPWFKTWSWPYE